MSTAFRYCETACGSRARELYAPSVPGVNGKTRGHYDPRAARQLGGRKAGPKRLPRMYTTAPRPSGRAPGRRSAGVAPVSRPAPSRAFAPALYPPSREPRLRHSPPLLSRRPAPGGRPPGRDPP